MSGFCKECGLPVKEGTCKNGHREMSRGPIPEIGRIDKPNTARRLLGSGIEFIAYFAGACIIASLDLATFGLLGLLSLVLVGLVVLRDFNAGAFSIAKRVSRMRVVDRQTGQPASNVQALARNAYYLGLLFLTILPLIDVPLLFIFIFFIGLDVLMIFGSPLGLRLGDFLAGTQVIEPRS